MKRRNGFVTNSSSSSFIIGKADENKLTLDDVFKIIKNLYKEWISVSNNVFEYLKEQKTKGFSEYPNIDSDGFVRYPKGIIMEIRFKIDKEIESKFGICRYDLYDGKECSFLQCETYKDYREWACDKIEKTDKEHLYGLIPFGINYLSNTEPVIYYDGNIDSVKDNHNWEYDEVIEWYCSDEDLEEYTEDLTEIDKENKINIASKLGQVCIYSQCGLIPDYVVKRLTEYAHLFCNHMG